MIMLMDCEIMRNLKNVTVAPQYGSKRDASASKNNTKQSHCSKEKWNPSWSDQSTQSDRDIPGMSLVHDRADPDKAFVNDSAFIYWWS